jgi:hypothetical protein
VLTVVPRPTSPALEEVAAQFERESATLRLPRLVGNFYSQILQGAPFHLSCRPTKASSSGSPTPARR